MTTKDTLALALEALEKLAEHGAYSLSIAEPAITAIKQAQEPVGINGLTEAETSASMSVMGLSKPAPKQAQDGMADAYAGAREDLAIWKRRALEAEELHRRFASVVNGPTFTGEPAPKQAEPCQHCGATHAKRMNTLCDDGKPQAEPAEKRKLYECTGCGHLHEERPSSCDCCENHGNDYNDWTASPTPPEAA